MLYIVKLVRIKDCLHSFFSILYFCWLNSKEVQVLARMVKSDPISTTFQNLRYLRKVTKLEQAEYLCSWRIRDALLVQHVPEKEACQPA